MRRPCRDRAIAARELVFPLSARLHPAKPPRDREIDGLIITKFEMEEGNILTASPIAAVECICADQVERTGDRTAITQGENQQDPVCHRLAEQAEESAGQVGAAPFARAGILVEFPKGIPMRFRDALSGQLHDLQPRLRRRAFLPDGLALA